MISKHGIPIFVAVFVLFRTMTLDAVTGDSSEEDIGFRNFLSQTNSSSPLETAGAHGSTGLRIGAGMTSIPLAVESESLAHEELALTSKEPVQNVVAPKLWITKGIFYPLDVGMTASTLPGGATQGGGYAQWTLYEEFARPAFSVRFGGSKIFGLQKSDIMSRNAELVASWGIYFVSAYIAAGIMENSLTTHTNEEVTSKQWTNPVKTFGIALQILPPFVHISTEVRQIANLPPAISAKMSLGI